MGFSTSDPRASSAGPQSAASCSQNDTIARIGGSLTDTGEPAATSASLAKTLTSIAPEARIELLCAAQALDLFTNLKPGRGALAAYRVIRQHVKPLKHDRELAPDIETVAGLIDRGEILRAVEKVTGPLL